VTSFHSEYGNAAHLMIWALFTSDLTTNITHTVTWRAFRVLKISTSKRPSNTCSDRESNQPTSNWQKFETIETIPGGVIQKLNMDAQLINFPYTNCIALVCHNLPEQTTFEQHLNNLTIFVSILYILLLLLLVWHAPLGVRSAKRRHQSPEWTILSHSYRLYCILVQ